VVTAVREIAGGANQTSIAMEQLKSTSIELSELSDNLREQVKTFILDDNLQDSPEDKARPDQTFQQTTPGDQEKQYHLEME